MRVTSFLVVGLVVLAGCASVPLGPSLCAWTLAEHDKGRVPIGGVWKRQYMRSCDSLTTLRTCEVDYLAGAYFPVFLA